MAVVGIPLESLDIACIANIARIGKSRNIVLVLGTQQAEDLAAGQGRVIIENCATKVVLRAPVI